MCASVGCAGKGGSNRCAHENRGQRDSLAIGAQSKRRATHTPAFQAHTRLPRRGRRIEWRLPRVRHECARCADVLLHLRQLNVAAAAARCLRLDDAFHNLDCCDSRRQFRTKLHQVADCHAARRMLPLALGIQFPTTHQRRVDRLNRRLGCRLRRSSQCPPSPPPPSPPPKPPPPIERLLALEAVPWCITPLLSEETGAVNARRPFACSNACRSLRRQIGICIIQ